ncbi:four-carbon acid sugar kinase family protein [Halomonas sediminis]
MSRCRVVIIADDLTGALDAAAPFASRGADARVVVSLERLERCLANWEGDYPQVLAVNTESRHLHADEAAARVADAARQLDRVAPELWFKKVDSTLRGQVIAESLALRKATGRRLLVAPAVPTQGRVVRDAEVWVEGMPLTESAYAKDARSAPLIGPLDHAFAVRGVDLSRHQPESYSLPDHDCVADAASDQDLARLYDAVLFTSGMWLMVGAAGLATAIAQRCFGRLTASTIALQRVPQRLYVVGSRSARAVEQCSLLQASAPSLPVLHALADHWPDTLVPQLLLVPGGEDEAHDPWFIAQAMGRGVAKVLATWLPEASGLLFLTGGDIAMAALDELGVGFIQVEAEWAPGVPLGRLDGDSHRLVMTKAGGFGMPDLLQRLHQGFH